VSYVAYESVTDDDDRWQTTTVTSLAPYNTYRRPVMISLKYCLIVISLPFTQSLPVPLFLTAGVLCACYKLCVLVCQCSMRLCLVSLLTLWTTTTVVKLTTVRDVKDVSSDSLKSVRWTRDNNTDNSSNNSANVCELHGVGNHNRIKDAGSHYLVHIGVTLHVYQCLLLCLCNNPHPSCSVLCFCACPCVC